MAKKSEKYFLNSTTYNCPYCDTGSVRFKAIGGEYFDWSNEEEVYCLRIKCQEIDCEKVSLHMAKNSIGIGYDGSLDISDDLLSDGKDIDQLFFYHHPNSSFVIDERIPKKIRNAIDEASTSHKMNLAIGSSAALRKAIYELLASFDVPKIKEIDKTEELDAQEEVLKYLSYQDRLELLKYVLKDSHPGVDSGLINDAKKVLDLVNQPLHERLSSEDDWKDFSSAQFLFLLETVHTLLVQIFVIPSENDERKNKLADLAKKVVGLDGEVAKD